MLNNFAVMDMPGHARCAQFNCSSSFVPAALRARRLFESTDIEFTRDQIAHVLQPHTLRPHGRWVGRKCYAEHVAVDRVGIGTIRFGNMQVDVPSIADYHLAIICLEGHARVAVNRREYEIGDRTGLLIAPGEEFQGIFSQDCEQFFVRISSSVVRAHSNSANTVFRKQIDLCNPALQPWLNQLSLIAGDGRTADLINMHPLLAREYERLLVSLLLAGQAHDTPRDVGCSIAPASVRRAEAYIRAHATDPLTLADIADAADVPVRTLLDSFKRFRSVSPIRFLKDVRLDIARERLRAGGNITAASVAFEAGFNHLGRFASAYAARFGEKPSDTLRANSPQR